MPVRTEAKAVSETEAEVDKTALFCIGYGLYVITTHDGNKDTGCIVNAVIQAADKPLCVSVCINKANYTHDVVEKTGAMNVNCLSVEAPFSVFRQFGFQSGRTADKFGSSAKDAPRSMNGLIILPEYVNAFMSLKVRRTVDLGSHTMFLCDVTEAKVLNKLGTMTYTYYQQNVKPKPQPTEKKGWVCKVCGYVYEGDTLPEDFVCPICKHPASDFEKL